MDSNPNQHISRRRLLHLGTLGLTTALTGCLVGTNNDIGPGTPTPEQETDQVETLPSPPAFFNGSIEYSLQDMPTHSDVMPNGTPDLFNRPPDNRLFNITIESHDKATVTLQNTNVVRDIELKLHVRDDTLEFQEAPTTILSATDGDAYETREVEFNLSNISIPEEAGSICALTGIDTHEEESTEWHFRFHQFVGIPHKNGVNWINTDRFNHARYHTESDFLVDVPAGLNIEGEEVPFAGHIETRDDDEERTLFLAARTPVNDEIIGVSCHIDHAPYERYVNGDEKTQLLYDMAWESMYATKISHLQELGTKTHNAISGVGITDSYEQRQALGDLIQMIPYGNIINGGMPPTVTLYEQMGDCSNKACLYSGIAQNSPWNDTPAYIDCYIGDTRHWTIGIDVETIEDSTVWNKDEDDYIIHTTEKQINNGYPDKGYAFFDMTFDSDIGEHRDIVKNESIYDTADFPHRDRTLIADEEPDF